MRGVSRRPEVSFVIRLWLARGGPAGQPEWRLQVRHVQSREETYCRHLADLLAFVERLAGMPAPPFSATPDHDSEEAQS